MNRAVCITLASDLFHSKEFIKETVNNGVAGQNFLIFGMNRLIGQVFFELWVFLQRIMKCQPPPAHPPVTSAVEH